MPKNEKNNSFLPALPDSKDIKIRKPYPGLRIFIFLGILYGAVISFFGAAVNATGENIAIFFTIIFSGGYTLLLYFTRRHWLSQIPETHILRNTAWIAFANALLVRTVILLFEQILQGSASSAGSPPYINLLLTLPWYIGLIHFFIQIQQKNHYHWTIVLLLAGFYEFILNLCMNGIILPWLSGQPLSVLDSFLELFLTGYWQFVILNSPIFLSITWILENTPSGVHPPKRSFWQIFLPLVWIFPYLIYFICIYLLGR